MELLQWVDIFDGFGNIPTKCDLFYEGDICGNLNLLTKGCFVGQF